MLGVITVGVLLVAAAAWRAPSQRIEIWLEVAKVGLQLLVVSVVGGGLTAAWRYLDGAREDARRDLEANRDQARRDLEAARDQARRLNDYRLNVLREIVTSYNRIKAVRRTLRAYGFLSPGEGTFSSDQAAGFFAQMTRLNDAQLSLEQVKRELKAYQGIFGQQMQLHDEVMQLEQYVGDVLKDWQEHGPSMVANLSMRDLQSLTALHGFLSDSDGSTFEMGAAAHMDQIEQIMGDHLSPTGELKASKKSSSGA